MAIAHVIVIPFCQVAYLWAIALLSLISPFKSMFLLPFIIFPFSLRILIQFLLLFESVNSLRGGSAVITTVMSGGAEERSLGRRKATVQ